ncbi:regulatory protein UhpC [Holospora obtusa F1]|uniref:Lysosomal dipeptide transporter MFSD1 n=1 Tax=Holospora obtusa F1 TaxID=1399147 RepID=W6TE62_HOLOB|nr:MFS transporter [Holospora obtusa]ETZ07211.1 regulatory protein UhpC [Holospora obtusa F1]
MQKDRIYKFHFYALWVWLFTSLFYGFQFFLRSSPNALAPQLMKEFSIDAQTLGIFSSVYYWTYSSLQIPVGMLLDMLGPKKVLRIGMLTCILGAFLFGLSQNFTMALFARALIGAGAAVSFIGSVRMNTLWFQPSYLAFIVGLLSAIGKIGGACANLGLPVMIRWVNHYSYHNVWQKIVLALSGIGLILAILVWMIGKNGPKDIFLPAISHWNWEKIREEFLCVAKQKSIWILGFYGYALYLTLSVFSDTFSIGFIERWLKISAEQASKLAALVAIGSSCGAPLLSFLSDFFKKRVLFFRLCAVCVLIFSGLIFFGPAVSFWNAAFYLFIFGFFSGGQVLIFVTGAESGPSRLAGVSVGTINAILMLSGALHNPIVGYFIQWNWDGTYQDNHPLYTLSDYQIGCLAIYVFFVIAFFLSFCLKESHPGRKHKAKNKEILLS